MKLRWQGLPLKSLETTPTPPPKQLTRGPIWLDDWGTGQWKWMEEVPHRTSLVPLAFPCFVLCLIGVETEGPLDYQGRAGDHFHCTVEPSPGHTRCRKNPDELGIFGMIVTLSRNQLRKRILWEIFSRELRKCRVTQHGRVWGLCSRQLRKIILGEIISW